jgi:hypothetical protein
MTNAKELNDKMYTLIHISSHENMLLKSIENFYNTLKYVNEFISIINSNSNISIRLIDYFVTKYSKKNKIIYNINNETAFNIHQSYKQQLKTYQKKNFDPFARGLRIPYFIGDVWIITTIGQLNFFKWFISKNILDYIIINKNIIEQDMNKNKKFKTDKKVSKIKMYKKPKINILNNVQVNVKNENKCGQILVTF